MMISFIKEKKGPYVKKYLPPLVKSWTVINHIILESWVKFHLPNPGLTDLLNQEIT